MERQAASYGRRSFRDRRVCKPLFEIPEEVVDRFGAYGKADRSRPNSGCPQLIVAQLAMRRAGWMDDQALAIAYVGQVRPQRDTSNEVLSGGTSASAIERE